MKTPVNTAVYILLGLVAYHRLALGRKQALSTGTSGNAPGKADMDSGALSDKKRAKAETSLESD